MMKKVERISSFNLYYNLNLQQHWTFPDEKRDEKEKKIDTGRELNLSTVSNA